MATVPRQRMFDPTSSDHGLRPGTGPASGTIGGSDRGFARLEAAKRGFCLRRVDVRVATLLGRQYAPEAGSLFLARVTELGHHTRIELPDGRRARLFAGDEVVACYGHRYAPDQYGIRVPEHMQRCALATSGGVAGELESRHDAVGRPTMLQPIGMLGDLSGAPLNLTRFALPPVERCPVQVPVFAVLGSSMNSGKTTTAACTVRGLTNAGMRVAAAKITGTGSGADYWHMLDAGAIAVRDFSDCGLPSTFRVDLQTLQRTFFTLLSELQRSAPDAIVIEISDGLFQRETAMMVAAPWFRDAVDKVLLAAPDAMALATGVEILRRHALSVAALSGLVSRSPLAMQEAAEQTGLRVLDIAGLESPEIVTPLLFSLGR
ncbi:MAG: DUF1611 domain-containing protein [Pseudomonadota bacterium]